MGTIDYNSISFNELQKSGAIEGQRVEGEKTTLTIQWQGRAVNLTLSSNLISQGAKTDAVFKQGLMLADQLKIGKGGDKSAKLSESGNVQVIDSKGNSRIQSIDTIFGKAAIHIEKNQAMQNVEKLEVSQAKGLDTLDGRVRFLNALSHESVNKRMKARENQKAETLEVSQTLEKTLRFLNKLSKEINKPESNSNTDKYGSRMSILVQLNAPDQVDQALRAIINEMERSAQSGESIAEARRKIAHLRGEVKLKLLELADNQAPRPPPGKPPTLAKEPLFFGNPAQIDARTYQMLEKMDNDLRALHLDLSEGREDLLSARKLGKQYKKEISQMLIPDKEKQQLSKIADRFEKIANQLEAHPNDKARAELTIYQTLEKNIILKTKIKEQEQERRAELNENAFKVGILKQINKGLIEGKGESYAQAIRESIRKGKIPTQVKNELLQYCNYIKPSNSGDHTRFTFNIAMELASLKAQEPTEIRPIPKSEALKEKAKMCQALKDDFHNLSLQMKGMDKASLKSEHFFKQISEIHITRMSQISKLPLPESEKRELIEKAESLRSLAVKALKGSSLDKLISLAEKGEATLRTLQYSCKNKARVIEANRYSDPKEKAAYLAAQEKRDQLKIFRTAEKALIKSMYKKPEKAKEVLREAYDQCREFIADSLLSGKAKSKAMATLDHLTAAIRKPDHASLWAAEVTNQLLALK